MYELFRRMTSSQAPTLEENQINQSLLHNCIALQKKIHNIKQRSKFYCNHQIHKDTIHNSFNTEEETATKMQSITPAQTTSVDTKPALGKLRKELQQITHDPPANCTAHPVSTDDLFHWTAVIIGPKNTPYEGGKFQLNVTFPQEYPFRPPQIRFVTKIYHPNISPSGHICLDTLTKQWCPALTISAVLMSISVLLEEPNADDPLTPEVASVYRSDRQMFEQIAKEWTRKYALFSPLVNANLSTTATTDPPSSPIGSKPKEQEAITETSAATATTSSTAPITRNDSDQDFVDAQS